jgi:hypothetical protein
MQNTEEFKTFINRKFEQEFPESNCPSYIDYEKLRIVKCQEISIFIIDILKISYDTNRLLVPMIPSEKWYLLGFNGQSFYIDGKYRKCLEISSLIIPLNIINMYKQERETNA